MVPNDSQYVHSDTWNEIISQSTAWESTLEGLAQNPVVEKIIGDPARKTSWLFVGCGTSFYLAEAAASSWTLLTGEQARAVPASEVLLYPHLAHIDGTDVQAMVISRSGQTSEAVRAARVLKREMHMPTAGITCSPASDLEAECDHTLVLTSADEKSTVMTRSFTSMLISLQCLAARHAGNHAFVPSMQVAARQIAGHMNSMAKTVETFAAGRSFDDYVFLGQGPFHGIAREAALKVMEMSCSYSQFFHALEFRHGPKAIVGPRTCLMFFISRTGQQSEVEVMAEMKALGGVTVAVCNQADSRIRDAASLVIELGLPAGEELISLAPSVLPAQLMGFFTGVGKGLNPDQPKNLTRVVILD